MKHIRLSRDKITVGKIKIGGAGGICGTCSPKLHSL